MNARDRRAGGLPSKKIIAQDWRLKYNNLDVSEFFEENDCWGCGIVNCNLERSHLLASVNGGSNTSDNLIILCKFCHHFIQEIHAVNQKGADFIKDKILDGHPFVRIKTAYMIESIKLGMYDMIIEDVNFPSEHREFICANLDSF